MSSEWEDATLGDYIDFKNGRTSPDRNDDAASPVFGSNGIIGHANQTNAPGNCLIIGRVGSYCGSVYHSYEKCWLTDNAILGLPKSEGESEFWYFLLVKLDLNSYRSGSGQPLLNQATIKSIPIRVPKLGDHRAEIGRRLMMFDNKIELNRQTNQTLEQIAQAIFKSWFVDFEPVKAKIQAKQNGQNPELAAMCAISGKTDEQLKGLDEVALQQLKTTAALFPDALVESGFDEIPEGWRYSEIGNEVTVVGGGTPSTKNTDFWEGGHIHWTTPRDMSNLKDKVLLDTDRKITEAGLAKISSGLLPKNTVLMSSRAPVGYLAIAKVPVAINQGYIAMKCESEISPEFVVQWTESVMDEIKQRASGTTFAEISKKNFKIIPVVVPDGDVISEYSRIASNLYSKITEGIRETKYLMEIRDTLVPKLLSGELELAG